jgi:hypothetical protein
VATRGDEELIPRIQRHDAPDPDRPYRVLSPLILWGGWAVAGVTLGGIFYPDLLVVAAACYGALGVLALRPGDLRAAPLARLDSWFKRRAKRRRELTLEDYVRSDRSYVRAGRVVRPLTKIMAVAGAALIPSAGLVALLGGPSQTLLSAGIELLFGAFFITLMFGFSLVAYAQLKGDEAQGPFEYTRLDALASWLESHEAGATLVRLGFLLATVACAIGSILPR